MGTINIMLNEFEQYFGVSEIILLFIIAIIGAIIITYALLSMLKFNMNREYSESNEIKNNIKHYTKGDYARDVKLFVTQYKTAKSIPQLKQLQETCIRIMNNVDNIDLFSRSIFTRRLWSGIHDTYQACKVTVAYIGYGYKGINELRNTVSFGLNYYRNDPDNTLLGVNRYIRTEHQVSLHKNNNRRIPAYSKKLEVKKTYARNLYLSKLNRWGS